MDFKKSILILFLIFPCSIFGSDPYTYDLIVVCGQSNAGDVPYGSELSNTKTWNINKFKTATTFGGNETYQGNVGFIYFLSSKLISTYPSRNFIFMQYNVRATPLVSNQLASWNAKFVLSLSFNLMTHIRECVRANGQPSSVQLIYVQGENDNGALKSDYLSYERTLLDTLPQYSQISFYKWKYYLYLPQMVGDTTYCNTVNAAKRAHASINKRVRTFSVDIANYGASGSIHMVTPSGISVCADTLMANFSRYGF